MDTKRVAKWEVELHESLSGLTNEELLELVIRDASGDDYDGAFTGQGLKEFRVERRELYDRLKACGFIEDKE